LRHLGHLSGFDILPRERGMARPQSRYSRHRRPLLLGHHVDCPRATGASSHPMKLQLTGLSHKTAPVHLREKLALPEAELPHALRQLQNMGATEAMILSTCNRVEIAVTVADHLAPAEILDRFLTEWKGSAAAFEGLLYRY